MPTATSGSTCGRKKTTRKNVIPLRTLPISRAVMSRPAAMGMNEKKTIRTRLCRIASNSAESRKILM